MREEADGAPRLGASSRTLGVRPGIDIPAQAPSDVVLPGQGGMSVSPSDPGNLPAHRRPRNLGGRGDDPVWRIDEEDLGPNLSYRPDPDDPSRHGFIEPSRPMSLQEYQDALGLTRRRWQK
jgi:hypothetical protein